MADHRRSKPKVSEKTMAKKLENSASFPTIESVEQLQPDPALEKIRQFYQDFTAIDDETHVDPYKATGFHHFTKPTGQN